MRATNQHHAPPPSVRLCIVVGRPSLPRRGSDLRTKHNRFIANTVTNIMLNKILCSKWAYLSVLIALIVPPVAMITGAEPAFFPLYAGTTFTFAVAIAGTTQCGMSIPTGNRRQRRFGMFRIALVNWLVPAGLEHYWLRHTVLRSGFNARRAGLADRQRRTAHACR